MSIGRSSDEIASAYELLCQSEKNRLSATEFVQTGGGDYSVLGNAGARGAGAQYPDEETLEHPIEEAWIDYDIQGDEDRELWRLHLTRERAWWQTTGDWTVCGIEARTDA